MTDATVDRAGDFNAEKGGSRNLPLSRLIISITLVMVQWYTLQEPVLYYFRDHGMNSQRHDITSQMQARKTAPCQPTAVFII